MTPDENGTVERTIAEFQNRSGLRKVRRRTITRKNVDIVEICLANPSERFFEMLNNAVDIVWSAREQTVLFTLKKMAPDNPLESPEGGLFLRTLSESQNVNRNTFRDDFFGRYTSSATNAEFQIIAKANHVVLGRRGAGKSMLLLYALHSRELENRPVVWIDMQVYSRRNDAAVAADIIREILDQTSTQVGESIHDAEILDRLREKDITFDRIRQYLPDIRRLLQRATRDGQDIFVFLDDYHVIDRSIQPQTFDVIYSITRGNNIYLKISAIETLTRTYDQNTKEGLEVPQDAQLIKLDYNLTAPDLAARHIESIIDAHARYSGLSSARSLCTSADVLSRLTWVAAGVPRDAISLFAQAITKATALSRHRISVSNVNQAASETLSTKLVDFESDAANSDLDNLRSVLDEVKQFCVSDHRTNAFLIKIDSGNQKFGLVKELISLRLLHVISEGITVEKAGEKYMGLILDYGFYTGIRAAQSVDLFNKQSKSVSYKDLRQLPVLRLSK